MSQVELRQQAGNLAGQFQVKGVVNANGVLTGTITLDSGDVQIRFEAKHLPILQKDDIVFVSINVVKTIVLETPQPPLLGLKN